IRYSIEKKVDNPAMSDFRVSAEGRIYVVGNRLDREKISEYIFAVVARDSGNPPKSATAQVQIHLTDVNDNGPAWEFPSKINQAVNLSIAETVGYRVAQLRASDPDDKENGTIIYKLGQVTMIPAARMAASNLRQEEEKKDETDNSADGQPNSSPASGSSLFDLEQQSGWLYVARSMNENDLGFVKLVVQAQDRGDPPKSNHRVLHVNIIKERSYSPNDQSGRFRDSANTSGLRLESDMVVIVIMVAVTLIISLVLIISILFLRCRACSIGRRNNRRFQFHDLPPHLMDQQINLNHHSEEVSGHIFETLE
ncbi:Chromodomain-helicase DNA-binding protein, partial [Cichlidogyrus casuarinus]